MSLGSNDLMDLGPFMQEYVLRNPFNNLQPNPTVPPPDDKNEAKKQQTTVKLKNAIRSQIKERQTPSPANGVGIRISPDRNSVGSGSGSSAEKSDADGENEFIVKENETGRVIDTPKGHIGSNTSYAVMLKHMKINTKHLKVKNWLLERYRYNQSSPCWVGSEELLKEVKESFSEMKSSVLSRIMKFTFPDCRKVINKYGYFYIGLCGKPTEEELKDADILEAVKCYEAGERDINKIAHERGVQVKAVMSVYTWTHDEFENGAYAKARSPAPIPPSSTLVTSEEDDEDDDDISATDDTADKDWKANVPMSKLRTPSTESTSPKWDLRKRAAVPPINFPNFKIKLNENEAGQPIGRWSQKEPPSGDSCLPKKKRGRPRKQPPPQVKLTKSVVEMKSSFEENDIVQNPDCLGSDHGENAGHLGQQNVTVPEISKQLSTVKEIGMVIKPEPQETDYCEQESNNMYHSSDINGANALDHKIHPSHLNVALVDQGMPYDLSCDRSHDQSQLANGRAHDVETIADMLKLKHELVLTKKALENKDHENTQLECNLRQVQRQVTHLREQLAHRESQVADLASEFFDLSNHFMKMSHHFKRVMTEIQQSPQHR